MLKTPALESKVPINEITIRDMYEHFYCDVHRSAGFVLFTDLLWLTVSQLPFKLCYMIQAELC